MINFSIPGQSLVHQPWLIALATLDFLLLDQGTKYLARTQLDSPLILVPDWLSLHFVENTGIAFSLPVPGGISSVLAVLVSLYLGYAFCTQPLSTTMRWAYVLIMAGAVGNLMDRLWFGAVTDFLAVGSFPVFNLADSFITVGVGLFIWHEVMSG